MRDDAGQRGQPSASTTVRRVKADPAAAAAEMAMLVEREVAEAIEERNRFLLAVSGGRTPALLFAELARRSRIPWSRTHVFFADERCVPPDHEASNYRLVRETLIDHVDLPAAHVHRIPGELSPPVAAGAYRAELAAFFGVEEPDEAVPTFDLVLLGVGADGHTASLFPDGAGLTAGDWAIDVVAPAPMSPASRVTLTMATLRTACRIAVLATGLEKAAIIGRIFGRRGKVPPAGALTAVNGVTWVLDAAAASELPPTSGHQ